MTNKTEEEAGPVTVQIGVCSVCHALFMLSGDRLTSPCHGADPLVVLATLTLGSNGQVTGEWGMAPTPKYEEAEEEPAPAPAPPDEPPADEEEEEQEGSAETPLDVARSIVALYVGLDLNNADEAREALQAAGAEPEAAATAVGRLYAVRELLQSLEPPREAVPVAPAPSEAESSPENT